MPSLLQVGLLLKATDQMSSVVRAASRSSAASFGGMSERIRSVSGRMEQLGQRAVADGALLAGLASKPIAAFTELEDASVRLQTAMTQAGGALDERFEAINDLAINLGTKLPGTTSDFCYGAA